MTRVFYSAFTQPFPQEISDQYVALVSFDGSFQIDKYRRWQDAQAHLIGRLLLLKGLATFGINDMPPLRYSDYQRPYVDLTIDFSISHSGEYVLCAMSDHARVGIDIEKIRPIDLADMRFSFSKKEWLEITTASNPNQQLFDYWTKKEAVAKADGRGLLMADRMVLNHDQAQVDDTIWYVKKLSIAAGYCAHLASSEAICHEIDMTHVDF